MNGLYELIDEDFIQKLIPSAREIALKHLFDYYKMLSQKIIGVCRYNENDFLVNANRRKIKLNQCYCPYCGSIYIIPILGKKKVAANLNYCAHCGKRPISVAFNEEMHKFIRIHYFTKKLEEHVEDKLHLNDFYHIQISTLASIIECYLRDSYISLLSMKHYTPKVEIRDRISKEIKNDFLNPTKAQQHFKKNLGIDFKELIGENNFHGLEEISALRNVIVHNNGLADLTFLKNPISNRIGTYRLGELIVIDESVILNYYEIVKASFNILGKEFDKINVEFRYRNLSLYYLFR